jgi:hypothetical protein
MTLFLSPERGHLTDARQEQEQLTPLSNQFLGFSLSMAYIRLQGNRRLARNLLMLLCQTQIRNDNREENKRRKAAGQNVKKGRKPKSKPKTKPAMNMEMKSSSESGIQSLLLPC